MSDPACPSPPFEIPKWAILLGAIASILREPRREDLPARSSDKGKSEQGGRSAQEPELAAHDPGRGRDARSPSEIPAKGWKDILKRVYDNIAEHRVISIAAGVTFFALLAVFPGLAALVALYGLFADPGTITGHVTDLATVLPGGATEILGEQLQRLTAQPSSKLGFALLFSLAISLWSANAGMKALFDALNVVYGEREQRGFFRLNVLSLGFTIGALVFLMIALSAVAVLPIALRYVGLSNATEWLIFLGKWPLLFAAVAGGITLIYRYGPSWEKPRWRWVTWGSAAAGFGWFIMSILFSWYATNFGSYNQTYGTLGAAVGFMTWLWLSSVVVLLGAELDAEMEHQTARDTTTGSDKPLGQRGARMADTVGLAKA